MSRSRYNPALHAFAVLTALATLVLLGVGGLVTSHGVGQAVPDWPTTYGYHMFFFPFSKWVGGIFYEHAYRLAGLRCRFSLNDHPRRLVLWPKRAGFPPLDRSDFSPSEHPG